MHRMANGRPKKFEIQLTANERETLALSAMLPKPFTIEKLLAVIRDALPVAAGHERAAPVGGESRSAAPG